MTSRRLAADRFFTSNYNAESYTQAALDWIASNASLKSLLLRHIPELQTVNIPVNAFTPWSV